MTATGLAFGKTENNNLSFSNKLLNLYKQKGNKKRMIPKLHSFGSVIVLHNLERKKP